MSEQKIDLQNHSTLHVARAGKSVRLGISCGVGSGAMTPTTAVYVEPHLSILIKELEGIREEMRKPPFEPVTITLNTADEVRVMYKLLGRSCRSNHADDLGVKYDDPRAVLVGGAVYKIYRFLDEKVNGRTD